MDTHRRPAAFIDGSIASAFVAWGSRPNFCENCGRQYTNATNNGVSCLRKQKHEKLRPVTCCENVDMCREYARQFDFRTLCNVWCDVFGPWIVAQGKKCYVC